MNIELVDEAGNARPYVADDYGAFLESKRLLVPPAGVSPGPVNPQLFDFQSDIVRWALRRGRAAIWADCGLGKTPMALEWARQIAERGRVLILTPLAVAQQFVREGEKFGVPVTLCREAGDVRDGVNVANYERLHKFNPEEFAGIVLDESSILKDYTSATRNALIEAFARTPYRLALSATPAPNDFMELGNHAEFLGTMTRAEMLAMFFVHDGGETQNWRLKGHARRDFWKWIASWAVSLRNPADIGYDGSRFILPGLRVIEHVVASGDEFWKERGQLFAADALTLGDQRASRRHSIAERVRLVAEMVNASADPWLVWCELNDESRALAEAIPGALEVTGSDSVDAKEDAMSAFTEGRARVLVTKPSIAGYGMNWQHCHNVAFVGLSHSFEQWYQAIRRTWRFGQTYPVDCHVVISDADGAIVANLKRKQNEAEEAVKAMVEHTSEIIKAELGATERTSTAYETNETITDEASLYHGDCVDTLRKLADDSIHYTIFSPPFASLYTYSNSDRDMGNVKDDEEFRRHFAYLIPELFRVTKPGRLLSFHCMLLPTSKSRDGMIGLKDFRGDLIRMFVDAGWIHHSEVVIWKDPVTAMQRTKALGLLHKQLKKDSCMSRQGIPDYLITMRKPGENPERVGHTNETFPVERWQQYASPVWMDIDATDTLQFQEARENDDERHICPLQLQVIDRALELWTNPGDVVLSPFMGIGSEGYCAAKAGRRFVGVELKRSYYDVAVRNILGARKQLGLFG